MSIKGKAFIVGAYEHPERIMPDKSVAQIHAEVVVGALADAGLKTSDVDGLYCVGPASLPGLSMADYLGLKLSNVDTTLVGGSSPVYQLGHAAAALATGRCRIAVITLASRP